MLQRKWSKKVQLPVGALWGKAGQGGVAGAMKWGYETPREVPVQKELHPSILSKKRTEKDRQKEVQLALDLESLPSHRMGVEPRSPYLDPDEQYFYTSCRQTPPVTRFHEDLAIEAVRSYAKKEQSGISDGVTSTRPPINNSARGTSRSQTRSKPGKKLDFRCSSREGSARRVPDSSRTNDDLSAWQNEVDDLLLDDRKCDSSPSRNGLLRPGSAFHYSSNNPDYFKMWKQSLQTPAALPTENDSKWLMSKFRKSAKPRVDTKWDRDPILRPDSKADSRVKVKFDCPEDSDMVVSVRVQKKKQPFFY